MEDITNLESASDDVTGNSTENDVGKQKNGSEPSESADGVVGAEEPTENGDSDKNEIENQKEGSEPTESEEGDANKNEIETQKEGSEPGESEEGDSNKNETENQKEGSEAEEPEEEYKLQPMFVCCCGASFQFLGQITSHKKKNCKWIYVCSHCDRVYDNFTKMTEHKQTHLQPVQPVTATSGVEGDEEGAVTESKVKNEDEEKSSEVEEDKSEDANKLGEKKEDEGNGKTNAEGTVEKQAKPKLQIKPVEKKIPPHFRGRVPNQGPGNFMGNQMRPNMMPNPGMMNPQGFMGGFNQGMNFGMGMQPMMNMGMGNFGPMNPGMNMGFGGFNMPNQFCGPNMGMNMGMMNMGGMNMGGPVMGMNMGGGMNNAAMMEAMSMGNTSGGSGKMDQGGFNPAPGGNRDKVRNDMSRDVDIEGAFRRRSLSPPPRHGADFRSPVRRSPPRRGLERENFRERDLRDRLGYREFEPIDRLGAERGKWPRDRYSMADRERGWSKRSMSREDFLFNDPGQGSPFDDQSVNHGFSGISKRGNSDSLLTRPSKMMRSSEYP